MTVRDDGTERIDYLYRISIKAVIYNDAGEVLVVKEHGLNWGLPGGGMEFGETFQQALARELAEEVGYTGAFTYDVIDTADPIHLEKWDVQQVWVVCHVKPDAFDFAVGPDADDMRFIDPEKVVGDDLQAWYVRYFHARLQERLGRGA